MKLLRLIIEKKKILFLFLIIIIPACNKTENIKLKETKKNIIVSIYPLKIILSEIVGNKMEINVLLPTGNSPHTFEPKPSDIAKIRNSSLLFYVDDNLDGWAAKLNTKESIPILKLLDKSLLINLNCCHNHKHEHIAENIDPHFWTSPIAVKNILPKLTEYILKIDPDNKDFYYKQQEKFTKELNELINNINLQLASIKNNKIFTYHNSFAYFIRDFNLNFGGVLEEYPGKESGTQYIHHITNVIKKSKTNAIFVEPQLNYKSAEIISKELGIKIITLDPIGNEKTIKTYSDLINYNSNILISTFKEEENK